MIIYRCFIIAIGRKSFFDSLRTRPRSAPSEKREGFLRQNLTLAGPALVGEFRKNLLDSGKVRSTADSYARDASGFLRFLNEVAPGVTSRLDQALTEPATLIEYERHARDIWGHKVNSVRRAVLGIRQFCRFMAAAGYVSESPFEDVPVPRRKEDLPGRLSEAAVIQVLRMAQSDHHAVKGTRDAALLLLLAYEGLKASEIVALRWADCHPDNEVPTLHVRGERRRTLVLATETAQALIAFHEAWQTYQAQNRDKKIIGTKPGTMFPAFQGRDLERAMSSMSRHGVKFVLYELSEKCRIKPLNTERLRHFAVERLIAEGRSPDEIMAHLGLRQLGNVGKHIRSAARASA